MVLSERLDFPSILLFMGIGQMLLVVAYLLFRKGTKKDRSTLFFALALLALSINLLEPALIRTRFLYSVPHLLYAGPGFFLLIGPFILWQYFALSNPGFKWKPVQLLHLIPFLFTEIRVFPLFLQSAAEKREVLNQFYLAEASQVVSDGAVNIQGLLVQLHPIVYMTIVLWWSFKNLKEETTRLTRYHLGYFGAFLFTLFFHLFAIGGINALNIDVGEMEWPLMSVPLYLFVCYSGFLAISGRMVPNSTKPLFKKDRKARELHDQLIKHVNENSPFLDSTLSLNSLAHDLNAPTHFLSKVINEFEGKNFFEFVNSYRIEVAKKLITDTSMDRYTLEAIAEEAGFSNKMSFNRAFKKHCGTTPSAYRDKMKKCVTFSENVTLLGFQAESSRVHEEYPCRKGLPIS